MELITEGKKLSTIICKLINKHEKFSFAVAWANYSTDVFQSILTHKNKITKSCIGIHFYQTDIEVLENFKNNNKVHFILQPSGVFHPKIYIFWSKNDNWDIIIGSANMTRGAFKNNQEICIHISSNDTDKNIFTRSQNTINELWNKSNSINENDISVYTFMKNKNNHRIYQLSGGYGSLKAKSPIQSNIMSMSWKEFFKQIQADKNHVAEDRCKILELAQQLFSDKNFSQMTEDERKAIAGLNNDFKGYDWGWFGSMKGAGTFKHFINEDFQFLSDCLDHIPLTGTISKQQYDQAIKEYLKGFNNERDGLGTFTRLLSMKRPDYFLCLNKKNINALCNDFDIYKSYFTSKHNDIYNNYWDKIIIRIQDSIWWNAPYPKSELEQKVWKGRVAMLDSIFYEG